MDEYVVAPRRGGKDVPDEPAALRSGHPEIARRVVDDLGAAGPPENVRGRIVRIGDAGTETRAFGKLGELVRTTRTIPALRPGDVEKMFETSSPRYAVPVAASRAAPWFVTMRSYSPWMSGDAMTKSAVARLHATGML